MEIVPRHPYAQFEGTPLWTAVETALAELEENNDFKSSTRRGYIVGYLCQRLVAGHVVAEAAVVKA